MRPDELPDLGTTGKRAKLGKARGRNLRVLRRTITETPVHPTPTRSGNVPQGLGAGKALAASVFDIT